MIPVPVDPTWGRVNSVNFYSACYVYLKATLRQARSGIII
ncbi:hypothetical protein T1E_2584 [Pseudomonas putida DOT-T1E]|uniref:Uncharacterized protein n=1 Tax=Pseudomonas putida (strain DOT-T1E) TaxID=1196325 RepID=I7C5N5_PSEPT|nr:hypothetical protein T1E_2584 [Pseudomonas putida DOT-T1E]